MVVVITVTDAAESSTSVVLSKMLESSLDKRRIDNESVHSTQPQAILDMSSSEATNTEFSNQMYNKEFSFHVDVRSFESEEGSPTESFDFLIASTPRITDGDLNETILNTLKQFSDVEQISLEYNSMYPSIYANLVLEIPTVTILVGESSIDLYRAAADEVAEVIENYFE